MGCAQTPDCYRFRVTTIVIATRNAHKVDEIRAILGGASQFLTLNDFPDPPKVVEDAGTFAGNATKKAVELARWLAATFPPTRHSSPLFVLADDSGLEVDALNGAPGVHSARFAAMDRSADSLSANSPDADNNARLLRLLKDVPLEKRTARFRCVIALVEINPQSATRLGEARVHNPQLFDGACEGRIGFEPHGKNGFGYDPLFVPVDFEQTFAELGEDVKNKLSHRARALDKLKAFFTTKAV
jgi:XTP/dITP diphosphohydrolase